MVTLTRPEGTLPEDLHVSRRLLGGLAFGGYAAFAFSAQADPIRTDSMGLITETVMLPAADRPVPAFIARPNARGRFPVVMVISEVFGVHEYIRDVCRRLAKLGYVALAPDFFARHGDPAPVSDFNIIREIVTQASDQQIMGDIEAGLTWLKAQRFADRKRMAITGFCWGGAVVWLACERFRDFRCGVAWYGRLSRPPAGQFLAEPERQWPIELAATQLKCPVLGLYAGKDQGIPLADVEAMRHVLESTGKVGSDIVVYPDAAHGFHADYRSSYNAEAAQAGWRRMLAFFETYGVAA